MRLRMMKRCMACVILLGSGMQVAQAQRVSLKTNALYWAVAHPNLGVEFRLTPHYTLNVEVIGTYLHKGRFHARNIVANPEVRYWFNARPQSQHFVGVMAFASSYDYRTKNWNHIGEGFGAGVTYGYSWVLSTHWSLETTAGLGAAYARDNTYRGENDPMTYDPNNKKILPVVKLGVSFVYVMK